MSTASDNITLNLGSGGPVVATDFVSTGGLTGHIQYVKLDYGNENAHQPVTTASPLPTSISSLPSNWLSLPVGGGTGGQGITINGTINAAFVGITNGTLGRITEGVSVDVRGFGGKTLAIGNTQEGIGLIAAGVSVDVRGIGGAVTLGIGGGTVDRVTTITSSPATGITAIAAGITVAVTTIGVENGVSITTGANFVKVGGLPATTAMTAGCVSCDNEGASAALPSFDAKKSIVIKNIAGATSNALGGGATSAGLPNIIGTNVGAPILVGATQGPAGITFEGLLTQGLFLLLPGEEVKFEVQDLELLFVRSVTGADGSTQSLVTYVAS